MAENVFDTLVERGYLAQVTHEDEVRALLAKPGVTFYIGFDPTADSLHVGHFIQMMVMAHLQRAGHRPIVLLGCGTSMIGDPSGRSDLRQVLTLETILENSKRFREQMKILLDFDADKALMVNNADWLLTLNYVDFLRDIGAHFSVNRMLAAECYKQRMEKGLTFLEFNYMLMQAYDFLVLYRKYGCQMQLGGDDQWSNILAGVDLVRRKDQGEAYGMTFKLLATSTGAKMGKTARGALWLDAEKTTPFEFYQYWRNIDDADVINCMKLLTFMSLDEINAYAVLTGAAINEAKKRLAIEVTTIVHGQELADGARRQAEDLFENTGRSDRMPKTIISRQQLSDGLQLLDVLLEAKLIPSKGEGRRLIRQNGIYLNGESVSDMNYQLQATDFIDGEAIVRKGKKVFHAFALK
ncbi:MAG: tyrosine--tRNA ligase [Clostridiaceae bacterium]|jgi:tyrosyl-tRNA synthetase|nr:tyrosine--tRNA ligase [Clostridiaceae bacterium]